MKGTLIKLGDEDRRLRYDMNAWAEIGDRLGIRIRPAHVLQDLREVAETPMSPAAIRTVLWAGLVHEDPDLTERDVGALVDFTNAGTVTRAFFEHLGEISGALAQEMEAFAETAETAEMVQQATEQLAAEATEEAAETMTG